MDTKYSPLIVAIKNSKKLIEDVCIGWHKGKHWELLINTKPGSSVFLKKL